MGLDEDLARIAQAASAHGSVTGVLAAEPAGASRVYVVSLGEDEERRWLVVDDDGLPVDRRMDVRDAASIVAMCELAGDVAGGGDLAGLRAHLEQLRQTERPEGIDAVEEAARNLAQTVGEPPRLATPAYLDAVGEATRTLESALGDISSPFAEALRSGTAAVDEFVREVERGYALPLR
jgi:hypothetical protein